MRVEEIEATIRRLIKTEDGIDPALRLLEQMLGTAAISEKEAEYLRRVIERRRIRRCDQPIISPSTSAIASSSISSSGSARPVISTMVLAG